MERIQIKPRPNWQAQVEELGYEYHTYPDGQPYWDESAYYRLSAAECDAIWDAAAELYEMLLKAAGRVMERDLFAQFGLPLGAVPNIIRSWERKDPPLCCRLDLLYDEAGALRLLECHGDTPGMLLESAQVQWQWKQAVRPGADQFNTIHEHLLERWRELNLLGRTVHFSARHREPDQYYSDLAYLREIAREVGVQTRFLNLSEIRWDEASGRFVDAEHELIEVLVKFYPWQWLLTDRYGPALLGDPMLIIEPAWKLMLSSRVVLALLWETHPGSPLLLPTDFEPKKRSACYLERPLFHGLESDRGGGAAPQGSKALDFDAGGAVYQEFPDPAEFDGHYPVLSVWIIGGEPAGVGIKEDRRPYGGKRCRFVPHIIE